MFYFNPGQLRQRITFQTTVPGTNEAGETIQVPKDYKTIYAAVEALKGREYEEAKKLRTELTYKITIRYTADITKDMTIKFKDRTLNIVDIINLYERNQFIQIMAYEKVD